MWNRAELKARGKQAFLKNYWKCVLVAFILSLIMGGSNPTTSSASRNVTDNFGNNTEYYSNYGFPLDFTGGIVNLVTSTVFLAVIIVIAIISICLSILIFHPLEVGGCRFFLENTVENPKVGRMLYAFQNGNYGRVVVTMFLKSLYTFLWTLLFIIPGIVKSYEYRMVPYLLADAPEMSREDAFRISKELMDGEKLNAFILDLSFIGWQILNGFTCGILGLFFVNPYVQATNAELFVELKRQYFAKHTYANQQDMMY